MNLKGFTSSQHSSFSNVNSPYNVNDKLHDLQLRQPFLPLWAVSGGSESCGMDQDVAFNEGLQAKMGG